jgi:NADH-quinone oxidoreductase subunit N
MVLLPDILAVVLVFGVLAADLFFNDRRDYRVVNRTAWAGLLVVFASTFLVPLDADATFWHAYRVTGWTLLFKQVFTLAAAFTVLLAGPYFREGGNLRGRLVRAGDFHIMLLVAMVGMFVIVSARDLVTLFVGLEMATIPLYVMTAFHRGEAFSAEASMKYILMGSLATAIVLFGYSLVYGATGAVHFDALAAHATRRPEDPLLFLGALFVFAAAAFKLAAAPFHMWAPDIYEGAPTPVTAFISVASKAAALGFMLVLYFGPLDAMRGALDPVLVVLAVASMVVGNLGALKQTNFRRFMAYSSIAQVGYLLTAFLASRAFAAGAILFYLFVYLAGNLAAFFVFSVVGQSRKEEFAALHGLSRRNPGLAAVLLLAMFSLAGVPPLAGFLGKFQLFASAAESGRYVLLLVAALNSVVSLYYYMIVIKEAYITPATDDAPPHAVPPAARWCLAILTAMLLVLGLWPGLNDLVFAVAARM